MRPQSVRLEGMNTEGSSNRYASSNACSSTSRRVGGLKAEEPERESLKGQSLLTFLSPPYSPR